MTHNIATISDLGKVATKENYTDLMKCLALSLSEFLHFKAKFPDAEFAGFEWTDDGVNEITETKIELI